MTELRDATLNTVFIGKGVPDKGRIADPLVAHKTYNTLTQYADELGVDKVAFFKKYGGNIPLIGQAATQVGLEKHIEELGQKLDHDILTDLYNRRGFDEALTRMLADAVRHKKRVGILFLDLDNFKSGINDTLGHAMGDEVLKKFSELLRESSRQTDIVARLGGDEFGVILPDVNDETPELFQLRLKEALESKAKTLEALNIIGVSMGYAEFVGGKTELKSEAVIVYWADQAMYDAKSLKKEPGLVKLVRWKEGIENNHRQLLPRA